MRRHIVLSILLPLLFLASVVKPESCSAATFTWTGTVSSDWFTSNNWAPSGVPSSTDTINLTNGAIILTAPVAIGGALNWSAGSLSGSPLSITSAGVLNINGSVTLENVLSNAGTVTMTGPASLTMYNNNTIYLGGVYNLAGALWDIQTNANLFCACYGHEFFNNAGTFQKSQGSGTTTIQMTFYNTGTVSSHMGELLFTGGGTLSGSYDTESGATINFLSGSYSMDAPPGITGSGLCEVSGGTLTLNQTIAPNLLLAGGNVVLGPAFQDNGAITNLALSGSTLVSTNTVTGTLTGTSGTLAGPLSIASSGVLNINGSVTLENVLSNAGTVTMTGPAALTMYNNNTIYLGGVYNLAGALWDIQTNANIFCACYGHEFFDNAGVLRKSVAAGTSTIQVGFTNSGTVNPLTGALNFNTFTNLGGTLDFGVSGLTSFGKINVANNIDLNGTATVSWLGGFIPAVGNSFVLIDYGSHSGTFANITLPSGTTGLGAYSNSFFSVLITGVTAPANPPILSISLLDAATTVVSWPTSAANYGLQTSPTLQPANWSTIPSGISIAGTNFVFTNLVNINAAFFRLKSQ